MGDDNGNGICFGAGIILGIISTLITQFLLEHLHWMP